MAQTISLTDDRYLAALRDVLHPLDVNEAWRLFTEQQTHQAIALSTLNAAIYSSEIEGERQTETIGRERIADLETAYRFAQQHPLNEATFLEAHRVLSAHLVDAEHRGVYRKKAVVIRSAAKIVYYAADAQDVPSLMTRLFADIKKFINGRRDVLPTPLRAFYHAALTHLLFVNIHPFKDGNGRAARLLEKWLLAEKLGERAWQVPSEKYYAGNMSRYFESLRRLGESFGALNYDLSLPFLTLPPKCLFEAVGSR